MSGVVTTWLLARWHGWRSRHHNPVSLALHMVGIPACFLAAPLMLILGQWLWAVTLFVGGYVLQFLGHFIEGNRSGEEMLLRKLLGMRDNNPNNDDGA